MKEVFMGSGGSKITRIHLSPHKLHDVISHVCAVDVVSNGQQLGVGAGLSKPARTRRNRNELHVFKF